MKKAKTNKYEKAKRSIDEILTFLEHGNYLDVMNLNAFDFTITIHSKKHKHLESFIIKRNSMVTSGGKIN